MEIIYFISFSQIIPILARLKYFQNQKLKRMRLLFFSLVFSANLIAQSFQSSSNPYFWKNKLDSKSEYWQQDVDYTINAKLDEKEEIISGKVEIIYTNNSPHALNELFFNLYQNAFIKESYLSDLQEANGNKVRFGKWEEAGKGNEILLLKVDGEIVKTEIDGSIMKAWLKKPMQPNTNIKIEIGFKTYYSKGGDTRRRMKSYTYQGLKHFNGAHWYPRLAVYDRKFGWCTDQHLNREFYGDFGNYRVHLDFPANYVVEATGLLQNKSEVLPDTLRKKLDISNYWNHPWDTLVTYHIPMKKGERKVWQFFAENVHDFAWVAGPHYRLDEKMYKGFSTVALVLEPHCSGWKNACDFSAKVINVYSKDFGQYAYPKMVVADCQDGMEYPMLTMDGGSDPGYRGLLAHEIGHNWFYGMVNNNETYRALLDEGFTQFLTVWALEAIDGKNMFTSGKQPKYFMPTATRNARCYDSYMLDAMNRDRTEINVHSDGFNGALGQGGGYRSVYNKTATMLYNLQYVLGDSLFQRAMKHYFNQWSFRHPYVEDFRNSIIEYTKVDFNWFFDQWIETSKVIDYKIFPLKKADSGQYLLKLKRKAEMQSPLDITIVGESGKRYNFYVPNTWFEKETEATKLPRWIGWDNKLKTIYTTKINLPEPPKYARIDTSGRLADINEMNNTTACAWNLFFDRKNSPPRDRQNYTVLWRPDFWYNNFDGIKAGAHFEGSLNRNFHNTELDVWINTRIGKWSVRDAVNINSRNAVNDLVSFRFSYQSPTHKFIKNSDVRLEARHIDGIALTSLRWRKSFENSNYLTIGAKSMVRYRGYQDYYNYMTSIQWDNHLVANTSLWLEWLNNKSLDQNVEQTTRVKLRSSILSVANYSYLEAEHKETIKLDKLLFKWRFFGRLGAHQTTFIPTEVLLNAGGANGEEMLENQFMRSVTAFPDLFTKGSLSSLSQEFSHLHYGGGINLRGYSFRNIVGTGLDQYQIFNQNSGFSLNTQLNFENIFPIKFRQLARTIGMNLYVFGDVGSLSNFDMPSFSINKAPILADAGIGTALTWKKGIKYLGLGPMTFRFDMPLFLSNPAQGEIDEQLGFRWLVGVEQAF